LTGIAFFGIIKTEMKCDCSKKAGTGFAKKQRKFAQSQE
jgi:hypothetical protein